MKKIIVLLLALAMVLSFTACGKKTGPAEETATPAKDAATVKAEEESAFSAEFTDKLYAIQQNYHMGTAGSSLKAATLAAEIMDIFTEHKPSAELIKNCVKEFTETLSGEALTEYPEQIDGVIGASEQINGENGKALLDDCGYTGNGYPWDAEKMAECFAAMKIS